MPSMTSLERTFTTIRHGIPDRVPVALHNFLATIRYAGFPLAATLRDGEMLAEAQLKFWKDFRQDVIMLENGVIAEAAACGSVAAFSDEQPARIVEHVLAGGLEGIDRLEVPDPNTVFPMCEVVKATRILAREVGKEVYIMGRADQGPVALAAALRGWETLIVDMMSNQQPELVQKLLDFCVKVQGRYMAALREAGAHGTATGEAGVDIIGPRLFRKFAHPQDCRLIPSVGSLDFPVALHICGDSTAILDDMISTGAQILELDYKTDMTTAKQKMRGKCTFLGPVNPELIWAGPTAEIQEATRQAIEILAPGGELILGAGCALGYNTPFDHIHTLVETAWKYGVYKPDGSLVNGSSSHP
jgi:uroporphyrinogen decarboxylase